MTDDSPRRARPTGWRPGHWYCLIICLTVITLAVIGRI